MARKKPVPDEEKRPITIRPRLIHLIGVEFEDVHMKAFTAFGRSFAEAAQNANAAIQRHYPASRFDISVEYANPEAFEKTGVSIGPDV